jgi:hypothetical protein
MVTGSVEYILQTQKNQQGRLYYGSRNQKENEADYNAQGPEGGGSATRAENTQRSGQTTS